MEAARLLAWYRQLYDVEDLARGKSANEVLALRREKSVPIMAQMRAWLDGDAARLVLPKSRLGEAIRYLKNQWNALTVFLEDGRVPIDNNETEQLMKQVATGRKNWLFIGSVEAGYRAAILLTIVSTAHRYHLDVWLYVKDVLDCLQRGETDLASLRADRWAQAHPEAIRAHRVAETRYRADAKATRRARRRQSEHNGSGRQSRGRLPQRHAPVQPPASNGSSPVCGGRLRWQCPGERWSSGQAGRGRAVGRPRGGRSGAAGSEPLAGSICNGPVRALAERARAAGEVGCSQASARGQSQEHRRVLGIARQQCDGCVATGCPPARAQLGLRREERNRGGAAPPPSAAPDEKPSAGFLDRGRDRGGPTGVSAIFNAVE